jgi:capsular exopolysaccharide synthesis family protein
MDFIAGQPKCPVILVTSSLSAEGKSFISANLSQLYAYSGKKVLLMELDLRKPHISEMLGVKNDKGFSNYAVSDSKADINDYIKPVPGINNVFLMASGPVPPNPAELLMLPKVAEMFEQLRNQYDVIIVDSSPIGLVVDAQILGKYSNVNLFIVRERYTLKNSLQMVNDLLEEKKFENLYLVVNDVKRSASYKYGYGYGYGYGNYGYDNAGRKMFKGRRRKLSLRKEEKLS